MTKSTMGTKLPRKLERKMQIVGEQIRLARIFSDAFLMPSCEEYMLQKQTARQIISEAVDAVKEWRTLATRLGIVKSEQERFAAVLENKKDIRYLM